MKDKEKQIEEMARKICIFTHHWKRYKTCKECFEANEYACQSYRNCKAFIEQGYRKLPEDSVVLSREEYEKGIIERESMRNQITELFNDREQSSKETAERDFNTIIKALEERKDRVKAFYSVAESVGVDIAIRTVKELAKQFCVKIKE